MSARALALDKARAKTRAPVTPIKERNMFFLSDPKLAIKSFPMVK
jgi:hypothetical protein